MFKFWPLFFLQLLDVFSPYKNVKIIQFSSMVDAFRGFTDAVSFYSLFTMLLKVSNISFQLNSYYLSRLWRSFGTV
jgi:hypothetical protein